MTTTTISASLTKEKLLRARAATAELALLSREAKNAMLLTMVRSFFAYSLPGERTWRAELSSSPKLSTRNTIPPSLRT